MDDPDGALLEAWRAGDTEAGKRLFARHFEAVFRFFVNKVPERDADDLLQETFLGCVEAKERFRGDSSFRTFILRIARNRLLKHIDRARRRGENVELTTGRLPPDGGSPSQLLASAQEQRVLLAALRSIPLELQIALELTYWESMPSHELAAVLEIPAGTVRSRLRRARSLLAQKMEELADDRDNLRTTADNLERWMLSLRAQVPTPQK